MSSRSKNSMDSYDKHMEHFDNTPLGKLQQQYWTTKQQMIKKLGKKEDEYVVMSDADLDAKLDLFETIEQSSTDLLKVIEIYQEKLINLSIEESEMSRFLKSQSTYDTKTKAGKMMAAVAKAQNFSSQQRAGLRLPLVRLFNEVETFRNRAVTDTYLTVRKMENARTEYRGALLWMKNISMELDPDTTKKLEKFRRVQAQVKKTKTKFDRLKSDVQQKIDLLAASRCNMFSHVLVNYQRNLILFWEKAAKTMNAVADAYKGYQYYEFNIIKDLVEPSKKLAEMVNKNAIKECTDENDNSKIEDKNESDLININEDSSEKNNSSINGLIDLTDSNVESSEKDQPSNKGKSYEDEVNELIDLMTLNEANNLNEQLKELEQLELEKKKRNDKFQISDNSKKMDLNSLLGGSVGGLIKSNPIKTSNNDLIDIDLERASNVSALNNNLKAFNDLINHANDEFEKEWESAFASKPLSTTNDNHKVESPAADLEFGFFMSAVSEISSVTPSNNLKSLPLPSQLISSNNINDFLENKQNTNQTNPNNTVPSKSQASNKQNWFDLFAELDPLKNPDAIGQNNQQEEERNC